MFFSKPAGGPDAVGGIFPVNFPAVDTVCNYASMATLLVPHGTTPNATPANSG